VATVDQLLAAAAFLAALGCGLIGGVFFAFSTFVMKALARRPAAEAIAAMQAINVAVINPMFLGVFLGTAVVCVVAAVGAIGRWSEPGAGFLLTGATLYVVGTFGVTIGFNVPLNNALAAVAPTDADAGGEWDDYRRRWSAWNHVRTAAAVAGAGCFMLALWR
jgi:uncharacterized membrane protein